MQIKFRLEERGFAVDARYIPVRLRHALQEGLYKAGKHLKDYYAKQMLSGQYLSVGRRGDPAFREGPHLRDSLRVMRPSAYSIGIEIPDYGIILDEGVPHEWDIMPVEQDYLRYIPYGVKRAVFSKEVEHPAMEPTNWISDGLRDTEDELLQIISDEIMSEI